MEMRMSALDVADDEDLEIFLRVELNRNGDLDKEQPAILRLCLYFLVIGCLDKEPAFLRF